ncbi:HK97 family phage prohead protease [Nocardia salmonicida]|uniref:HK97 family phage prohead protease n=1 Tax=Nocardia salmonicida TaxID=53431 RepID=UPI002E2A976F|nr:HK97 family phage prohead protease [Nocardia salmonicida]
MHIKQFRSQVKAAGAADGLKDGQVRALVSVFGNVDSVGDIVMPGAFAEDLTAWAAKGDPIPAIWSHDWRDPFAHVGVVLDAKETEAGLETLYEMDLDNAKAAQVYRLLKGRRVTQSSFAYDILDAGWAKRTDEATGKEYEVYELRKLHIIEVGPTLVGANEETELLAVKSAELARGLGGGRVLSTKNVESLTAAHAAIGEVLANAAPPKSSGATPDAPAQGAPSTGTGQPGADAAADSEKSAAQSSVIRSAQARGWLEMVTV